MLCSRLVLTTRAVLQQTNTNFATLLKNNNIAFVGRNVAKSFTEGPASRRAAGDIPTSTIGRRRTLREMAMAPSAAEFTVGKGALAGGAAFGLGALAYYGLGLSKSTNGIAERSIMWPQYVRDRIHATYGYVLGGLGFTAASAVMVMRTPAIRNLAMTNSMWGIIGTLALMMGTGIAAQAIPYENTLAKHSMWAVHAAAIGFAVAPLTMLGGPLLLKASVYTAGIVGGLSTIAVCAPSEQFLNMAGPLAIGLGVVFAASLGSMFLPPTTALGASLYSISMYGGLLLFSGFLLYDTQKIVKRAEMWPMDSPRHMGGGMGGHSAYAAPTTMRTFDPINASIGLYLDILNIFIRMAMILSGGQRRK